MFIPKFFTASLFFQLPFTENSFLGVSSIVCLYLEMNEASEASLVITTWYPVSIWLPRFPVVQLLAATNSWAVLEFRRWTQNECALHGAEPMFSPHPPALSGLTSFLQIIPIRSGMCYSQIDADLVLIARQTFAHSREVICLVFWKLVQNKCSFPPCLSPLSFITFCFAQLLSNLYIGASTAEVFWYVNPCNSISESESQALLFQPFLHGPTLHLIIQFLKQVLSCSDLILVPTTAELALSSHNLEMYTQGPEW